MALISAIITSATLAATAMTATAAVTAVASTVAAVGTLVGAVGLAVTAVGAIIGDKTLMKIGGYMGMAGGAASLAGWAVGGIAQAGGIGNWIQSGIDSVKSAISPSASVPGSGPTSALQSATDAAIPVAKAPTSAGPSLAGTTPAQSAPSLAPSNLPAVSATPAPSLATPGLPASAVPGPSAPMAVAAPTAPAALSAPTSGMFSQGIPAALNTTGQAVQNFAKPGGGIDIAKLWSSLPDSAKSHLMIAGGQGLAGMAGGLFEAMSASERLEFDQLINAQRERQVQYQNRNAAFAPTVSFSSPRGPAGMLNTAGGRA